MCVMKATIVSIILSIVFGCMPQTKKSEVKMNEKFTLGVNQQVFVKTENLTIEFVSVLEDSRCPVGVDCFWEGNAKIQIKLDKSNEKSTAFELNTNLEPKMVVFQDYEIQFVDLAPRPKTEAPTKIEDYSATFLLVKR